MEGSRDDRQQQPARQTQAFSGTAGPDCGKPAFQNQSQAWPSVLEIFDAEVMIYGLGFT